MRMSSVLSAERLDEVRSLFATAVVQSCELMKTDPNWTINSIEVPIKMNSVEVPIKTTVDQSIVLRVFDRISLYDEVYGQKHYSDLQRCISKSGCVVVKAGMLIADRSTRLKRKHIVSVFSSLLKENEGEE